jgi:phosphate transport system substrate-binding protein
VTLLAGAACALRRPAKPTTVRIAGSDTMSLLTRRWAEAFMARSEAVVVQVRGGGTGAGIDALIRGDIDVCAASRPLFPDEVRRMHERHRTLGVSTRCARDALSVFVHPLNPIENLTLLQLKGIFTGRIGNWRRISGLDRSIELIVRQPNSGTYRLFQEFVLNEEPYGPRAVTRQTNAAVVDAVGQDQAAIGYGGLAFGHGVTVCAVEGVKPTPENVRSGAYPLGRYLSLLTVGPPRGSVKAFVDWTLGPEGQAIVAEEGYVPLWTTEASAPEATGR